MTKDIFRVLRQPTAGGAGAVIFSIVGNEMYFLSHFLEHYRNLGIQEFCFLVDTSDDGTLEYLMEQEDCWVLESDIKFGDHVRLVFGQKTITRRFSAAVKFLVPKEIFQGRWVLTIDADEFLILPAPSKTIPELIARLEQNGLDCCRAPMVDFFPAALSALDDADAKVNPFSVNPFYDAVFIDWPNKQAEPSRIIHEMGVRSRLRAVLMSKYPELLESLKTIGGVRMNKVPLLILSFFRVGSKKLMRLFGKCSITMVQSSTKP